MDKVDGSARRRAFECYLRTGQRAASVPIERKFNPYHDPQNGQFTFAPGGSRSISNAIFSDKRGLFRPRSTPKVVGDSLDTAASSNAPIVQLAQYRPPLMVWRRTMPGNQPQIYDPMTLAQTFPRLASTPAGSVFALANNLLDLTTQADALTQDLTQAYRQKLVADTKAIDPSYQPREQAPPVPSTIAGQAAVLNELRFDRAAAYYKVRKEERPLQLEVLRMMQTRVDRAYDEAVALYDAGRLVTRLSREEAIGNYVDRRVRDTMRVNFNSRAIDISKGQRVRVVGREYDTSGSDRTFRIPDVRVGNVAFDATLTQKTMSTAQVRGFFSSDSKPDFVIIVRPTQLGPGSTYSIRRRGE